MKILLLISTVLLPCIVYGQHIASADDEPLIFYEKIRDDLASENVKHALRTFREVISYYNVPGRQSELPERYFGMALALAFNGHYRQSIRYHKLAIRQHRKHRSSEPDEIRMNLGLTYALAGHNRKARRILGDSVDLFSTHM